MPRLSRRSLLLGAFALAATAVLTPSNVFDYDLDAYQVPLTLSRPAVGMVFLGGEARVMEGERLLREGKIDHLVFLSEYPKEKIIARFGNDPAYLKRISFLEGAMNTDEEAMAGKAWLKNESYKSVVLISSIDHLQRCLGLMRASPRRGTYISSVDEPSGAWEYRKRVATRLWVTSIPRTQLSF